MNNPTTECSVSMCDHNAPIEFLEPADRQNNWLQSEHQSYRIIRRRGQWSTRFDLVFHSRQHHYRSAHYGGHCINTSRQKWPFLIHPPCHAWSRFPKPTPPPPPTHFFFFFVFGCMFFLQTQKN